MEQDNPRSYVEPSWKQEFVHQLSFLLTYCSAMVTALAVNSAITASLHEQHLGIPAWKLWVYALVTFGIGMITIAFMSKFDRLFGYPITQDPAKRSLRTPEPDNSSDVPRATS